MLNTDSLDGKNENVAGCESLGTPVGEELKSTGFFVESVEGGGIDVPEDETTGYVNNHFHFCFRSSLTIESRGILSSIKNRILQLSIFSC